MPPTLVLPTSAYASKDASEGGREAKRDGRPPSAAAANNNDVQIAAAAAAAAASIRRRKSKMPLCPAARGKKTLFL